jgi:hypothetical protein
VFRAYAGLNEKAACMAHSFKSRQVPIRTMAASTTTPLETLMSRFTDRIRPHVNAEIRSALAAEARGHFDTALRHLEHAHVLGQRSTAIHVRVHRLMLSMALRNGWVAEAIGQAWRVVAAAVFTPLGLLPEGNPGSASVGGFVPMPVLADLQRLIDSAE